MKRIGYINRNSNSVRMVESSLLKRLYSKRKEFAPCGSKFFPFKVESFSKGTDVWECKQEATKIIFFVKNDGKSTKYIKSSLRQVHILNMFVSRHRYMPTIGQLF